MNKQIVTSNILITLVQLFIQLPFLLSLANQAFSHQVVLRAQDKKMTN
jgi:hypothetical protein